MQRFDSGACDDVRDVAVVVCTTTHTYIICFSGMYSVYTVHMYKLYTILKLCFFLL